MKELEKCVVESLDGQDYELFQFIPYLLQDIWEIGTSPDIIIELIKKQKILQNKKLKIIDLGCGKGAVSIKLAKEFDCYVKGVDALPDFIEEAKRYAKRFNVTENCDFEVGDIRITINDYVNYDIAILGSIGPVLGNTEQTLKRVVNCIKERGFIIIDEVYIEDKSDFVSNTYSKKKKVLHQIKNNDLEIVDEYIYKNSELEGPNSKIFKGIKKRANELKEKHPNKVYIFDRYVESQRIENEVLEKRVKCVTWLLKKIIKAGANEKS